jgi:PPK2 family polyphosphate:nucleotide phosphotransferase
MARLNPAGVRVDSFKAPTSLELAHDFLWRVHRVAPATGWIEIFNRSHYEDVLVTRVEKLVPKRVWRKRFDQINRFEELLTAHGTIVLKFFLYISKQEQYERLMAREQDASKAWKLSTSDWVTYERYDDYIDAYQDALERCSTESAPWYVVPSNHKWYRNLAVAQTVADTLGTYQKTWERKLKERGERILAEIAGRQRGEEPARARKDRVLSDD